MTKQSVAACTPSYRRPEGKQSSGLFFRTVAAAAVGDHMAAMATFHDEFWLKPPTMKPRGWMHTK